ncbi:hypothetical protein IPL85_03985 [Candidatus Saccharibacteria bacterium]|nr:MAG: hypothetical protein IPL85_03985 [Candidatus Saccharibacteria bacterium]
MYKLFFGKRVFATLVSVTASRWFWRGIVGLFVIQAVYIALVGQFSMAFDEHFHLAAINEYSKVLFPWQVTQPPGPAELSAFTADGSYLYHYLMSFPYRLLRLVTTSQTALIVMLRLLDVGIVVAGWYVFRRLLFELKLSAAPAHVLLAICMLMPMAPFMAGQLTYDALFFTSCGVTVLLLVRLLRTVSEQRKLPLSLVAWVGVAVLVTLQTKYAFFPAALGAGLYMIGYLTRQTYQKRLRWSSIWQSWRTDASKGSGAVAVGVLLLTGVLFVQRYGMNYLNYGSLVPECQVVLSHERCLGFAPYGRDADIREKGWYKTITQKQRLTYPYKWYEKMIYESYFAVGPKEIAYPVAEPLPVPYTAGKIVAALGALTILLRLPWILRKNIYAQLLFAVTGTYVVFLFLKNYGAFLATAVPLSIHGRYVLPFLPLAGYLVYIGLRPLLRKQKMQTVSAVAVSILLLASLWGGGMAAYIIRSQDTWYWPTMQPISRVVRSVVAPFILK